MTRKEVIIISDAGDEQEGGYIIIQIKNQQCRTLSLATT